MSVTSGPLIPKGLNREVIYLLASVGAVSTSLVTGGSTAGWATHPAHSSMDSNELLALLALEPPQKAMLEAHPTLLQQFSLVLGGQLAASGEECAGLREEVARLEGAATQAESRLLELEREKQGLQAEVEAVGQTAAGEVRLLQGELARLRDALAQAEMNTPMLQQHDEALRELRRANADLEALGQMQRREMERLQADMEAARTTAADREKTIVTMHADMGKLQQELSSARAEANKLRVDRQTSEAERAALQVRADMLGQELREQQGSAVKQRGSHNADLRALSVDLMAAQAENESLKRQLENSANQIQGLNEQLQAAEQQARAERQRLEGQVREQKQLAQQATLNVEVANTRAQRCNDKAEALAEDLRVTTDELNDLRSRVEVQGQAHENEIAAARAEMEEWQLRVATLTDELKVANDHLYEAMPEAEDEEAAQMDQAALHAMAKEQLTLSQLYVQKAGAEKEAEAWRERCTELEAQYQSVVAQVEATKPRWMRWRKERDELKQELGRITQEHSVLVGQQQGAEREVARAQLAVGALQDRLAQRERDIDHLKREIADGRTAASRLLLRIHELEGRPGTARQGGGEYTVKSVSDLLQQNADLKAAIKMQAEQREIQGTGGVMVPIAQQVAEFKDQVVQLRLEREQQEAAYQTLVRQTEALRMLYATASDPRPQQQQQQLALPAPDGGAALALPSSSDGPDVTDTLRQQLQQATAQAAAMDARLQRAENDARAADEARERTEERAMAMQQEIGRLGGVVSRLEAEAASLRTALDTATRDTTAARAQEAEAREKAGRLGGELAAAKATLQAAEEARAQLEAALAVKDGELRSAQAAVTELQRRAVEAEAREREAASVASECRRAREVAEASVENRLEVLRADIRALEAQAGMDRERLAAGQRREEELSSELGRAHREARIEADALTTRLANESQLRLTAERERAVAEGEAAGLRAQHEGNQRMMDGLRSMVEAMAGRNVSEEAMAARNLQRQLEAAQQEAVDMRSQLAAKEDQITTLNERARALEEENRGFAATHDQYKAARDSELQATKQELQQAQERMQTLEKEVEALNQTVATLRQEAEQAAAAHSARVTELQGQVQQTEQRLQQAQAQAESAHRDAQEKVHELEQLRQRYEDEITTHAAAMTESRSIKQRNHGLQQQVTELKNRVAMLDQELSTERARQEGTVSELQAASVSQVAAIADLTRQNELLHRQLAVAGRRDTAPMRGSQSLPSTPVRAGAVAPAEEEDGTLAEMREIVRYVRNQNETLETQLAGLKMDVARAREQLHQAEGARDSLQAQLDALQMNPAVVQGQEDYADLMERLRDMNVLRESNARLRMDAQRANDDLKAARAQHTELQAQVAELRGQLALRDAAGDRTQGETTSLRSQIEFLERQVKRLRDSQSNPELHMQLQKEKEELQKERAELQSQVAKLRNEAATRDQAQRQLSAQQQAERNKLVAEKATADRDLAAARQQMAGLNTTVGETRKQLEDARKLAEAAKKEAEAAKKEAEDTKRLLEDAKRQAQNPELQARAQLYENQLKTEREKLAALTTQMDQERAKHTEEAERLQGEVAKQEQRANLMHQKAVKTVQGYNQMKQRAEQAEKDRDGAVLPAMDVPFPEGGYPPDKQKLLVSKIHQSAEEIKKLQAEIQTLRDQLAKAQGEAPAQPPPSNPSDQPPPSTRPPAPPPPPSGGAPTSAGGGPRPRPPAPSSAPARPPTTPAQRPQAPPRPTPGGTTPQARAPTATPPTRPPAPTPAPSQEGATPIPSPRPQGSPAKVPAIKGEGEGEGVKRRHSDPAVEGDEAKRQRTATGQQQVAVPPAPTTMHAEDNLDMFRQRALEAQAKLARAKSPQPPSAPGPTPTQATVAAGTLDVPATPPTAPPSSPGPQARTEEERRRQREQRFGGKRPADSTTPDPKRPHKEDDGHDDPATEPAVQGGEEPADGQQQEGGAKGRPKIQRRSVTNYPTAGPTEPRSSSPSTTPPPAPGVAVARSRSGSLVGAGQGNRPRGRGPRAGVRGNTQGTTRLQPGGRPPRPPQNQ